ncbi:hypothetical protein [Phenylobacterium sp.]|jgi:hypothetical protein|uniref:hypothetical protein n=1 Tax=Phenylobacterium sp. TaxID=1871053 RepID=UPI002F4277BC
MSDALAITEAEAAGLSELAALDLAMARDFAARAQAAEDPDAANALARSYQRMARSYRQSLALKAKLRLEVLEADRETPRRRLQPTWQAPAPLTPADEARIDARAEELHDAVERVIWAEHEPADPPETENGADDPCGLLLDRLEEWLDRHISDPAFGRQPLDDHVVATCRALGLSPDLARRWRDLPGPAVAACGDVSKTPPGPAWRGSG